jgi:Flp pilus assembly protein TadG
MESVVMSEGRNVRGPTDWEAVDQALDWWRRWPRSEAGNTIIEIALTLPILLTVMTAIWQFGIVYNQMITLTQATTVGAQVLQTDRLSPSGDPCADTSGAISAAAPTLSSTKIAVTITINGTKLTKNSCSGQALSMGDSVSVQSSYPYTLSIAGMSIATGNMNTGAIAETEY